MHKKYIKNHHHSSTSKKYHSKHRKDNNESALDIARVPQNSINELRKNFKYDEYEIKKKSSREKHKKSENTKLSNSSKSKQVGKIIYNIADIGLIENEPLRGKERKEKQEKERLNKIEKYLEGLNKADNRLLKNRSRSLDSSNSFSKKQTKHLRREKTFHAKVRRDTSTNSRINISDEKNKKAATKEKEMKSSKKHKRKTDTERETHKEKHSKDNEKKVLYCQVELENPFLRSRKQNKLQHLYTDVSRRSRERVLRKQSSSRDRCSPVPSKLEYVSKDKRDKVKPSKEKRMTAIKFSPRKSKLKTDLRSHQRSNVSLGVYNKCFVVEKPQKIEATRQKKQRRQKVESEEKVPHNDKRSESKDTKLKSKRYRQEKTDSNSDNCKIEDDLRSYFSKIQNLIDKKLDFILGYKEPKNPIENESSEGVKIKQKKERKEKESRGRERSQSMKSRKEVLKKDLRLEDESRQKRFKEATRESRRDKEIRKSNTNIKRERYPSEASEKHLRCRSPQQQRQYRDASSQHDIIDAKRDSRSHKRYNSPYQYNEHKVRPDRLINMVEHPSRYSIQSNTSLAREKIIDDGRHKTGEPHPPHSRICHYNRDISPTRRSPIPGEDDFKIEPTQIQEAYAKKMKKRLRQLKNLECKTVSIVGIPSQIRESTIFNQTQTTTSLNIIDPTEEFIEKKKQSKRFKLYYKYSVADNKCPEESDKSSEERKSIVSDSFRAVSDPSDYNVDVWEENVEETINPKEESSDKLAKIMFMIKKDKMNKNCGDVSANRAPEQHVSKKKRKRDSSPKAIRLNNIVEEPSNISIVLCHSQSPLSLKNEIDCTFFNSLKSSSSECNMQLIKKYVQRELDAAPHKHKNRSQDKNPKENVSSRQKSPSRKGQEKDRLREIYEKSDKRSKCDEEHHRYHKKIKRANSHHKIKKKHFRDMYNYNSKSDINISYDSLTKYKFSKRKPKIDAPSCFREQLKYILPDVTIRKQSPERKSIGSILKEELREIIKELPRRVIYSENVKQKRSKSKDRNTEGKEEHHEVIKELPRNEISSEDLKKKRSKSRNRNIEENEELNEIIEELPKNKICSKDMEKKRSKSGNRNIEEKETSEAESKAPDEKQSTPDNEEKKYCSKKIGTRQPMTRIPSLIKGYVATTTSQITKEPTVTSQVSFEQDNADNISVNSVVEFNEKDLVDAATEVTKEIKVETSEQTEIILENKKSQTPRKLNEEIVKCDFVKQNKPFKKLTTASNTKRCQIIDPFTQIKIGCVTKPTRPIINLENNHFPNRKLQELDKCRPMSAQYTRQKSILLEGKAIENNEYESQEQKMPKKYFEKRPATAESKIKDTSKKKSTRQSLTMSTNVVTINTTLYAEKSTETCRTTIKPIITKGKEPHNRARSSSSYKRKQGNVHSKSTLSLNDVPPESRRGADLTYMDDNQQLNSMTNYNFTSVDRTAAKGINTHPSRLFLTKTFSPAVSTYYRRKMYDESIRKKMKKKVETQNQIGPRIFEVRYLTLENGNDNCNKHCDGTRFVNQKYNSKLPTFNTKINKAKTKSKVCRASLKKSKKFVVNKEDACKFSGRDIFAPLITDVDQLNKFRKKSFPDKKVEEIFMNNTQELQSDSQNCSVTVEDKVISTEQVNPLSKSKMDLTEQNFKDLIDSLYSSIISYCNTKFKLAPEDSQEFQTNRKVDKSSQQIIESRDSGTVPPPINEKSYVIVREPPEVKKSSEKHTSAKHSLTRNSSSDANIRGIDKQLRYPKSFVCCHLSCPVLAGSTSSFEYLYEEGALEINKDAVLSHFRKPVKTILGYTFNNTHHSRRRSFLSSPRKDDQASNSITESEESGYSSTVSKKCASASSFFKRPSIANLFKPLKKLEDGFQSASSLMDPKFGPNMQEYNVMNQKCIEYAEKVRNQTKNNEESEEIFQEIPLDVLLHSRKNSVLFDDFNSKCSLCNRMSNPHLPDITEGDELTNSIGNLDLLLEVGDFSKTPTDQIGNHEDLLQGEIQSETLIFYKDADYRPSLEIITFQKSQSNVTTDDTSELIKEMAEHPVIPRITNLNTCSLTVIEDSETKGICSEIVDDIVRIGSNHTINKYFTNSQSDLKSVAHSDIDGRSDISSASGFRSLNSRSMANKYMAKRFFENLLKVYEKEMDVTNKLFQDDDFFFNVLLESVKSGEVQKTRNLNLKKFFKGKIKNCIGNMLSKNHSNREGKVVEKRCNSGNSNQQRKLQILAGDARKYFSMFVQAVKSNKDINDEVKICGLLKLLERIEDGDFAVLRRQEEVDFEEEIKCQVKEAFLNIYQVSMQEAKKRKRCLTTDDLKLIRTFVSKYRIGLLSKTDLIATYIGRGAFKTEGHLKAAVTYLIQQNKNKDVDLRDFDEHCKILAKCSK